MGVFEREGERKKRDREKGEGKGREGERERKDGLQKREKQQMLKVEKQFLPTTLPRLKEHGGLENREIVRARGLWGTAVKEYFPDMTELLDSRNSQ